MNCVKCGHLLREGIRYCTQCGEPILAETVKEYTHSEHQPLLGHKFSFPSNEGKKETLNEPEHTIVLQDENILLDKQQQKIEASHTEIIQKEKSLSQVNKMESIDDIPEDRTDNKIEKEDQSSSVEQQSFVSKQEININNEKKENSIQHNNPILICGNCGKQLKADSQFCSECGCELEGNQSTKSIQFQEQKMKKKKTSKQGLLLFLCIIAVVGVGFIGWNIGGKDLILSKLNTKKTSSTAVKKEIKSDEKQYILQDSNNRYLTLDELDGLTPNECVLARNEIYARHGVIFEDKFSKEYFEQCTWYVPTIEKVDFDDNLLNEYEKENLLHIFTYEQEMEYYDIRNGELE